MGVDVDATGGVDPGGEAAGAEVVLDGPESDDHVGVFDQGAGGLGGQFADVQARERAGGLVKHSLAARGHGRG